MFETAELGRKLDKPEYESLVPQLRTDLLRVQNELFNDPRFSVVIVIAGVDGAGKGDTVNILHEWMDPRFLQTHAFGPPSDEEADRPGMWRFWRVLPPKGRIGIFNRSYYEEVLVVRVHPEFLEKQYVPSKYRDEPLEDIIKEVRQRARNFRDDTVREDDVTLMLLRWHGPPAAPVEDPKATVLGESAD